VAGAENPDSYLLSFNLVGDPLKDRKRFFYDANTRTVFFFFWSILWFLFFFSSRAIKTKKICYSIEEVNNAGDRFTYLNNVPLVNSSVEAWEVGSPEVKTQYAATNRLGILNVDGVDKYVLVTIVYFHDREDYPWSLFYELNKLFFLIGD